jgi:phosphoheptose isomerase
MNTKKYFLESIEIKQKFIKINEDKLNNIIEIIINCLKNGNKILIA